MPDAALSSPGPDLTCLPCIQALVRLPMPQRLCDASAGLDTAGFVPGYRGSPLGDLDLRRAAQAHLRSLDAARLPGAGALQTTARHRPRFLRLTEDRKLDRRLLADYERLVGELVASLRPGNQALAVELASLPDHVRGYGHIRKRHAERAKRREPGRWRSFAAAAA